MVSSKGIKVEGGGWMSMVGRERECVCVVVVVVEYKVSKVR